MLQVSIKRTRGLPQLNRLRNLPGVPHLHDNRPIAVKNTPSRKWPIVGEVNTRYPIPEKTSSNITLRTTL